MCDIDRPCISPPPVAIRRRPPKPLPWPVWLAEKSLTGVFRLRDLCPRPIRSFLWAAIEPAARFLFTDFIYRPALLPLTRFLFPLRCWIGRTLYKKTPETFQIDPWTWVKWGPGVSEEEAETMRFVAQHSAGQVPVPQVFDAFNRASISNQWIKCHLGLPKPEPLHCILMAHVPGLPMPWALKNSSEECMTTFTDDISRICKAIRRLTPTGAMIGNIRAGPCLDWRVFPGNLGGMTAMDIPLAGPFDTTAAFHDFICSRPPERMNDILVNPPDLRQTLREAFDDSDPIVFSHADLRLDHIYVDPMSGKVTNVLDWGMAGYYPLWYEAYRTEWARGGPKRWSDVATACGFVDSPNYAAYHAVCTRVASPLDMC